MNIIRYLLITLIVGAFFLFCYIGDQYADKDSMDFIIRQVTTW